MHHEMSSIDAPAASQHKSDVHCLTVDAAHGPAPVAVAQLQQLQAVGGAVHLLLHCALHKHAPRIFSQRQVPMLRLQQVLSIMILSSLISKGWRHNSYVERTSL